MANCKALRDLLAPDTTFSLKTSTQVRKPVIFTLFPHLSLGCLCTFILNSSAETGIFIMVSALEFDDFLKFVLFLPRNDKRWDFFRFFAKSKPTKR